MLLKNPMVICQSGSILPPVKAAPFLKNSLNVSSFKKFLEHYWSGCFFELNVFMLCAFAPFVYNTVLTLREA